MDPSSDTQNGTNVRFPRPRGDGPPDPHDKTPARLVSPPTRGWTRSLNPPGQRLNGFPAHAGMDPIRRARPWWTRRFPRPRGDGPVSAARARSFSWVSPPTRGWTPRLLRSRGPAHGFPAHAGMDPTTRRRRSVIAWFPRPRGDGPVNAEPAPCTAWVSPPTRGWTLGNRRPDHGRFGFPAHAGMDPSTWRRPRVRGGFPRPRGDGPPRAR